MPSILNNQRVLTALMGATWDVIYFGRCIVRASEALESTKIAQPSADSDDITMFARLAWKLRDAGEAVERLGESLEARVVARSEAAGIYQWELLAPLVDSAARSVA